MAPPSFNMKLRCQQKATKQILTLLQQVVSHKLIRESLRPSGDEFERQEFLGDKVLGMYVAKYLTTTKTFLDPNGLTRLFESITKNSNLEKVFDLLDLNTTLLQEKYHRKSLKSKADVIEAIIGELYLSRKKSSVSDEHRELLFNTRIQLLTFISFIGERDYHQDLPSSSSSSSSNSSSSSSTSSTSIQLQVSQIIKRPQTTEPQVSQEVLSTAQLRDTSPVSKKKKTSTSPRKSKRTTTTLAATTTTTTTVVPPVVPTVVNTTKARPKKRSAKVALPCSSTTPNDTVAVSNSSSNSSSSNSSSSLELLLFKPEPIARKSVWPDTVVTKQVLPDLFPVPVADSCTISAKYDHISRVYSALSVSPSGARFLPPSYFH